MANEEKYRLKPEVDQAIVKWVHENCSDDTERLPTVIWNRQDQDGVIMSRPADPFCVITIISVSTAEAEQEHEIEDDFLLYFNTRFVLNVALYDNRQDHGYLNAMLKLRQSLSSQRVRSQLKEAGISFLGTRSEIVELSFGQPSGSQLKCQQDYMFNYIDVVRDANIGYISYVRAVGEVTTDTDVKIIDEQIPE